MEQLAPRRPPWYLSGAMGSVNYRRFITGNAIALIGFWTQRVATGWLAWELTHSPAWLGLVAFADLFPVLILGPFAGAVADRHDRLKQVRICQGLSMAQALLLLVLSLGGLLNIWLLLALAFALGVIQSFDQPARLALVGSLVERQDLASAIAINSVTFNLARFLGPIVTGLAVALHSASLAFGLTALCFVASVTLLGRVRVLGEDRPRPSGKGFLGDLASGLHYTLSHRGLMLCLTLITAINVGARPILELLPAFTTQVFGSDASGFAGLGAAIGAGATLGGLFMVARGNRLSLVGVALVSGLAIALSALAFCLSPAYWLGALAILVLGFFLATSGIAMQSLVQLTAASDMRGRVLSLYGLLFRAGPALGGLVIGYAAEHFGLRGPTLVAAAVIAATTLWAFLRRKVVGETMADGPLGR